MDPLYHGSMDPKMGPMDPTQEDGRTMYTYRICGQCLLVRLVYENSAVRNTLKKSLKGLFSLLNVM